MSVEPRKIKKIVRPLTDKEVHEIALPGVPYEKAAAVVRAAKKREPVKPDTGSTPRIVEGMTTLSQLAVERRIQAQLARLWLKKASIARPAAGWRWKVGSRDLTRVRKALGLKA